MSADLIVQDAPRTIPPEEMIAARLGETPFDHERFYSRLRELREEVVQDAGGTFIPLIFGMPRPTPYSAEPISEDNKVAVSYEPNSLTSYPRNTFRQGVPVSPVDLGNGMQARVPGLVQNDPMTEDDVNERVRMMREFDRLRFPNNPSEMNQMNGVTVITNNVGDVSISMNSPYPISLPQDSTLRHNEKLAVPFQTTLTNRLFLAAVLRKIGLAPNEVYQALATQPRAIDFEQRQYTVDERAIIGDLSAIPSLDPFVIVDLKIPAEHRDALRWEPSNGVTLSAEEMHKLVFTTARFDNEGNVIFDTSPPIPPQLPHTPTS